MPPSPSSAIRRFPDLEALSRAAARDLTADIQETLRAQDHYALALAGGSTPRRLYELLAAEAEGALPWSQIHLFWGDERFVPLDHPDSNARMANNALVEAVPIPPDQVHPMPTHLDSPDAAAAAYAETLRHQFSDRSTTFDTVLLGLGGDGHTASLFPETGTPEQRRTDEAWVRPVTAPPRHEIPRRLTCTLPVLNGARRAVFLVAGARKEDALARVLDQEDSSLPAAQVAPRAALLWYVDAAARPHPSE
ncbi:6-phosphogluconolactonase [Salinibacter ruber]|uniref:6-phosphogluconolactonase n=1 Tax=Salinibacter ruber TaxID=146919 RepID=UPI002167BC2D|nr:6-phosphogluconolactonase [Salinibacter ruber]MCS4040222.1 6-phosphogluconolactonase [Salinibacter ruber]